MNDGTQRQALGSVESPLAMATQAFKARKVAPWPWATSPWNWDETLDQWQAKRLKKSEVR